MATKSYFIAIILLVSVTACEFAGESYQLETAVEKMNSLMEQIYSNAKSYGWYSAIREYEVFIESSKLSFDHVGDTMPYQGPFDLEERPKLHHAVGSIASGKFVSNGQHPYTGIFRGADNVIIRMSNAGEASFNPPNANPGLAMKVLRDGVNSANILAIYSLLGQSSFNLFEHDFTNHVPYVGVGASFKQQLQTAKFKTATQWPTMMGLKDSASYDQFGNAEPHINFPFRLVFHPSNEVHNAFDSAPHGNSMYFLNDLQGKQFSTLYEVYAQDTPTVPSLTHIGQLKMTSAFTSSYFGDKNLFYQHQQMEDDFAVHPEWIQPAQAIVDEQASIANWTFPDLPFN